MPRIDELYSALNQQGLYTKSLDDFKNQFSTPEAINQLHFALKQEGLYTKSLSDFNNQFFSDQLKKKEEGLPSMPSAEGGLLGTTPMPQDQPLVSFGEVMPSEAEQSPIFQQYQAQKAQQPQGLEYGLPEQKAAAPFVQETKKGLFGEELPVQAQPTVPQKPLEVVQSLLPYNFEDLTESEKITALTNASNSPEVLKSIQTDIESERKKIAEEIEAEKARIAAEEAKNVSDFEKLTRSGIASGKLANKIAYLETLPTAPTSSDFFEIASLMKEIQENTVEDEGGTIGFFKHLPAVVYQSLVSMATAAPSGVAGATAGGIAGSVAGPGGMIAGLISGFGGGSSLALEYSSSLMSSLQEAGVNVTSARELSEAFNSPEKMAIAREYALKRGIPVAVFDAISGGIAGKFFKPVAGATAKQVMNAALKETGLQSGLGGLGELSAQLIADGEVNMRDVLYEMVAEPVTSIPEIAAGRMSSNTKSLIAKEVATPQQKDALLNIDTKLREVNNAQILTTDETTKSVLGDVATKLEEEKNAVLSEIEKNFDYMTDEEAANVLSASREIKTLQDKAEQVRNNPEMTDDQKKLVLSELKRQAETFDNQRKEIIQNAVQKQATSEVPVQPEARVGEEVAEGAPEAKPEVVTEEGVQEEVTIDAPAIVANTKPEVDIVVAAAPEVETGQTFNSDGTVYSNGGLVVPVTSENITQQELTPERIAEFVEANKAKIGSSAVKVGIYKFPNSNKVSLDLNIVVPKENRTAALEFGKIAGQESLFDLDTFENVKTGADGMNPMSFTDDQFKQIAKSLSEGKVPDFMMAPVDQTAIGQTIQNTAQSLQVAFPEVEFIVGDNLEDTRARIVEALTPRVGMEKAQEVANDFKDVRGQTLFAGKKPVAIVVDKAAANTRTAGHEAWEVMLNDAFGQNPEKFAEFRSRIDRTLRLSGFNDIAEELRTFSETYSKEGNEAVFREYMAEFGGMLVEGGFDIQNLTPQQKSLLQKIKDIINDFAMQLTGKEVFLKDATAENIIDFMSTISQKVAKGETVEEFFEGASPEQAKDIRSVNQKKAIEILDGPKFDSNKKEDVASFLNGLRESVIPPDSPKEQLIERFINNVYEEVGYYLYSKGDPRAAGLTWYIEDMVEFGNKVKVLLPELSNQDQYKLFLSILAFTSSGTNPNQNLLYAYNLWNNSNDPKNFDFSKNWGDSKMSFIDKNGKAIAAGSIIKETSSQYTVQLIDSVGKLVVDSKGNPKTQVIAKKSLKEGYPKSTGYTNRGEIVVGQLEKLEKLYKDLGSIEKVVKWLETPHPIAELREYNQSVPDVNGNGPGVTNKQYDPTKNAEGERNGAFVFGEKIGSFYQNMIGIGETITMDLWWSRTWNRYMGTMLNTVSGKTVIQETPRTDRERNIMREAVKMVADDLNLQVSELQAAIWYFEQELWTKSGNASPSYSYVTAVDDLTKKLKVDEATRTRLQEARADLSAAEKRKQAAAERAASVVAGKGGKGAGEQITSRSQKKAPAAISEDVYKYLTEDENGNIVFHHYSSSQRDQIKPSSGQGSLLTSKEEQQALSSVGGLAMYYAQEGQKEPGVGNELHTVVVPRDKVYDIRKDPMNFYDEAKERFLEHMNRNNTGKPIEYAFSPNYQVAWITKVAGEKGFDMTVAQWKNKADYRAQSTKTLTPEAENIKMKPIEGEIEVGDLVQIYGQESVITDIDENGVLSYVQKGSSGKFDLPMSKQSMRMGKATLLDKGPYVFDEAKQEPVKQEITARAQKLTPEEIEVLNENFGIQDGEVELSARSQKITPSQVKAVSGPLSSLSESKLESLKELIHKDVKAPKKTQKAYKLFKVKKGFPGELFPLFVGANESVTVGEWIEAKEGEVKVDEKTGKKTVKSTLGPLAYRPGWHSGDSPMATHIGSKANKSDKKPTYRSDYHVWAEIEVGDDFDWQKIATERAETTKDGKINVSTAHITDQVPLGGFYRYKTNPNMTGNWIISGDMKVNRVLTDQEVKEINKKAKAKDLPRLTPFDYNAYGFNEDGSVKNTKQVVSNQIARAYIVAKETGENPELVSAVDSLTTITSRSQKINYKDLPGYDRMRNEVDGIIEKATKRGATKARIAQDVINYVQKSAVYERANDSQREQMIRDLKKELGQRVKSAPRVERILDIKPEGKELITNTQMIAEREKAAKDSVSFLNSVRAQIASEIKAMEKSGVLSAKQAQTIINKASKVNLTKPEAVKNFVDYVQKVFKNAEYGEKLSQSNALQKRIKRLSKSDKVAAGTKAVAKQFAQIEPRRVENIEEYLEYASALYNAMKPTVGRVTEEGADVGFKSAVEYDKVQDYANEEIKRQEKQKVDEILARNEDLVMAGVLTEDMNIDEIKKIIDAINSEDAATLPPAEKEKMIRDYVKKAFGYYRTIALSMIQRGVDPFTGEEIELTESQKKLARRFLEVDTDTMPLKEAYAAVEAIDNFIVNKVTDGMAATIADYVGQVNANNLAKEGYRGKPLRLFYSKKAGRAWAEQIEQLDLMVQRMFGGVNKALAFMRASGANAFKVGKTTTQVQLNNILNKYAAKFGELKGFRDLENVMERGVLSFVSRSVNENSTKQQNEFERRKALVEETLAYMKTGTEKEQSQAIELQKVYDNILKGSNSIDQVEAKVKDFNKEAVKFWIDEWSSKYDQLQDLSRNVYNVVLGSDINYTPDRFKRVSGKDVAEAQWGESMFANSSDYFDTKEAGVLMENKRIQTLGKRPSRIVSFDFDVNMSNSMYDALMDINTAEATRQMKSFFNSEGFEKIVPTKDDRDLMVDRMKKFVIRSKRKDYVSQDQLSGVFKAMNTIAGLGAGRALGGILQAPKQTIGVAFNTMINSGGRLSVVDAIQANQFINDSGYAIALRGIASNADIQSINKILEKASQTKGDAALRLLNKASEMWLNTFLVKPDVWIARTSWISYYKQQLDKMGYDTSNIDWTTHKLNKEAADYAQAMLDRQQNYSDSDLAGEFFASKEPMKMFLRKTFFPFMTFVMNQKSRMYADLSIIGNKEASSQEKLNAGKSLTGMAIELAIYSGMSMFFSSMLSNLTDYLWGEDESEEEKKKRMKRSMQYYAKNIVSDILSPLPVTNEPVRIAFNMALEKIGIDKDTFELPRNFEKAGVFKDLGMNAIAAEKLLAAYDKIQMAATGKFMAKDFFGNDVEKQVDEETREKMMYVAVADFMYALGFAPSEFGTIANKATKKAQKKGKKVRESGSQPGGVIQGEIIQAK